MMDRQYHKAHDCPQCGEKDNHDWGGARMWSSEWGHNFSCCSEECGKAFAVTYKQKVETSKGRKWLKKLWEKLEFQCSYAMTGEPYPGYPWR